MKPRYRKFRQTWGAYYSLDTVTNARKTLGTRDPREADRLLHAMNEAECLPGQNRRMAQVYLSASDPEAARRTWQFAMEEKLKTVKGPSHSRWITANKDKALDQLRHLTLAETRPEHVLTALHRGTVATNVFLRKLHNFALDMGWLLGPVLPRAKWPKILYAAKRAITETEHRMICQRETNPERRAFYEVLWHTGASQTDAAMIRAENIDWPSRVLRYSRQKNGSPAAIRIGPELEAVLHTLPTSGPLFPYLRTVRCSDRATEFKQRCQSLGIRGVTPHSYRYAWAQRAKALGYPERWAQQALGHSSKAVHRAYAAGDGSMEVPSLDAWREELNAKVVRADFDRATTPPTSVPEIPPQAGAAS